MTSEPETLLKVRGLCKGFTMHLQGGLRLPVVSDVALAVRQGECVVLGGPSGAGKSSLLKMVYGNYAADAGMIEVLHRGIIVDIARAAPRQILEVRKKSVGYVSQFLSVIPRVSARDLIADVARAWGATEDAAQRDAADMLDRLNIPETLWSLPPATFSGGEQQRVNIARGFMGKHPLLLLDEPTASLDAMNRKVVLDLINEKKTGGVGMLGIFHDPETRAAVADRIVDVTAFSAAA
ncbi:MAG: phosphonate C-P lyase system protein PhnL [Alphaproteobacteria bacterium]|nr:phosphonate C-P lyase system protein PhnL [Alphaproteobacteria bacterium]